MTTVTIERELPVDAEQLWSEIGPFDAVERWHPAIRYTVLEEGGQLRRSRLVDDSECIERLVARDDDRWSYTYEVVSGPAWVPRCRTTLSVEARSAGRSVIRWASEFTPTGAPEPVVRAGVARFLRAGTDRLHEQHVPQGTDRASSP